MKVEVDANALHDVLHALIGPDHLIRELQATRRIHELRPNPIQTLLNDYEAWRKDGPPVASEPSPEQIDSLAMELHTMGVKVPPRDTAFFHAAVRKWLDSLKAPASGRGK